MLTIQEIILSFALIGVLGGWALGRVGSWLGNRRKEQARGGATAEHRIRALEAELRVAQRKAEEAELALERQREEFNALRKESQTAAGGAANRDRELERLRRSLAEECAKTQKLRVELTQRAEEAMRATVRVKDAETELSVARAGSDAVLDQIRQLSAERAELNSRLQALQAELAERVLPAKVARLPARG